MDAAMLLLAVVIAGVNFGWQSAEDGSAGYEYIVQVEPELVDAMQRGDSIPIESNIPPEVAPIRKVRIVVGREELPRAPLRHTANFAGQDGWAPDRYPAATGTTSNLESYPGQAPSLINRTQTAVTETSGAISDGVQAGMRSAQSAGTGLQNATEQTFNATGNQIRQAGNSLGLTSNTVTTAGTGGVSAPPWPPSNASSSSAGMQAWPTIPEASRSVVTDTTASPGMAATRTTTGWTSIGTNVAAPPLLNPPLTTAPNNGASVRVAQSGSLGPDFPAPPTATNREPIHSVLVDPSRQPSGTNAAANTAANGWGDSWGAAAAATPATIGQVGGTSNSGNSASNVGLVPVQPRYPSQPNTQQAADRWGDPWAESDPWKQQQQNTSPPPASSTTNVGQMATNNGWPSNTTVSAPAGSPAAAGQPIIGPAAPPAVSSGFGVNPGPQNSVPHGVNMAATNLSGGNSNVNQGPQPEQVPWMPLLLVTLSLVGSLSANFYLVLSYLGARQKYVSLVQKTANTFRRAAGAAAAA